VKNGKPGGTDSDRLSPERLKIQPGHPIKDNQRGRNLWVLRSLLKKLETEGLSSKQKQATSKCMYTYMPIYPTNMEIPI
jgi:hypothetical protein